MPGRKVTIVGSELLGRPGTGGAGTADSLLAVALGRQGHKVELLIASGREIGSLSDEWTSMYESSGVTTRVLGAVPGVQPPYLAPGLEVFNALRENPPEVVIADDWRALVYSALRARQIGLALEDTAFVIHCHGPGRVLTEFAQKVPDTLDRFGEAVAERTCIGLADAVVSPSAWLLDWMRRHGWPVPESARVIPYVREWVALDRPPARADANGPVRRLVFFGQLREGKGIRIFVRSLAALEPRLLDGLEVVFLGSDRGRWTADGVLEAISPEVRTRVSGIRFETQLDRDAALAELRRAGSLAVMPSLLDNSPNTVSECIDHGVPFVATATGGIPELVAESDRARVLCEPTADALATVLTNALESRPGFAPAQPASQPSEALEAWLDVVENVMPPRLPRGRAPHSVALVVTDDQSAQRAGRLADTTHSLDVDVVQAESRGAGLFRTSADWIMFLDNEDYPDDGMLDALVEAQAASGADAVTCGVRVAEGGETQFFLGEPGALGLVENQYGVTGLVRGSLLVSEQVPDGMTDPDWPLLANLSLAGAKIVSVPEVLAAHAGKPGRVDDVPGDGVVVLEAFESRAAQVRGMSQLAATLGAGLVRTKSSSSEHPRSDGFLRRAARKLGGR
jgi:glycosyltransferase involved in cell wall biosynthesis